MKTVNSLSGGKTSSYIAAKYPADYNVFSLVRTDDINVLFPDAKVRQMVSDRIGKEFIGTLEEDTIIYTMLDLEQYIGQEIIWLSDKTFDEVIASYKMANGTNYLPNQMTRFCTTDMKIRPIAEYIYHNVISEGEKVFSNVGIRYDEKERAKQTPEEIELKTKIVIGKRGTRNKWADVNWGVANYPLVYDKITHYSVHKFWQAQNIKFPEDSNCVGCFWKDVQQLRKNYDDNYNKMEWFNKMEINSNYNWKSNMTYEQIKTIGLQQDFFFGTGSGCQAGFCTD
jgi:hypothetical protein